MKKQDYDEITQKLDSFHEADTAPSFERSRVVIACASDMTPQPVCWLWPGWLALGKLHILAGAPGQGKTTIAIAFAATITIGGRGPDGARTEPGNILIWSGEDDPADTLLPRLLAAGANRERCYFVEGTRIGNEVLPFDPATDMAKLQKAMETIGGIKLLIVDPVVNAVAGDSHKNTEVRRALQPLVDLAESCKCALLGITHFSKGGQGGDPAQRVIGSVAFAAVARVVMVAAKVQGDEGQDKRILARSKSNIGPDDGGFQYHMEQIEIEAFPGIEASRITWGEAVAGSARELLTDPANDDGNTDHSDAVELLRAELVHGEWMESKLAEQPLRDAGFTKKQIYTATKKLGIFRKKGSNGKCDSWYWRLHGEAENAISVINPEDSRQGSQGSNILNGESWESSGKRESSQVEVL
jgi:putative DNA primase/helicase